MIKKINKMIEESNARIKENESKQEQFFVLLDKANNQVSDIQGQLEKIQLDSQQLSNKIKELEIVRSFLEEINEERENEDEE